MRTVITLLLLTIFSVSFLSETLYCIVGDDNTVGMEEPSTAWEEDIDGKEKQGEEKEQEEEKTFENDLYLEHISTFLHLVTLSDFVAFNRHYLPSDHSQKVFSPPDLM